MLGRKPTHLLELPIIVLSLFQQSKSGFKDRSLLTTCFLFFIRAVNLVHSTCNFNGILL